MTSKQKAHTIKSEGDLRGLVGKLVACRSETESNQIKRACYEGIHGGYHVLLIQYRGSPDTLFLTTVAPKLAIDERGRIDIECSSISDEAYSKGDNPYLFNLLSQRLKEASR